MYIPHEDMLSELAMFEIKYADRTILPFDERFKEDVHPAFSLNEQVAREKAIWRVLFSGFSYVPGCFPLASQPRPRLVTTGNVFDQRKGLMLLSPASLSDRGYWELHTGLVLPEGFKKEKSLDGLFAFRECLEARRIIDLDAENAGNDAYIVTDYIADGTAVSAYVCGGGSRDDVVDYINARWTSSFLGHSAPQNYTSPICQWMLRRTLGETDEEIPGYNETFYAVRELQLRTIDELKGRDTEYLDGSGFRLEHQEALRYMKNDIAYEESIWTTPHINYAFLGYAQKDIFAALEKVKDANITPGLRGYADMILDAQRHFIRPASQPASRPSWELYAGKVFGYPPIEP